MEPCVDVRLECECTLQYGIRDFAYQYREPGPMY